MILKTGLITSLLGLALMASAGGSAGAQTPEGEMAIEQHPTAIHQGSCEAPGELVAGLVSLIAPEGEGVGPAGANPVKQGTATVELPMADIVGGEHILVAMGGPTYAPDRQDEIIACGAIGGVPVDGVLTFGLAPVNGSQHVGLAMLRDADGGSELSIYVVEFAGSEAYDEAQA